MWNDKTICRRQLNIKCRDLRYIYAKAITHPHHVFYQQTQV